MYNLIDILKINYDDLPETIVIVDTNINIKFEKFQITDVHIYNILPNIIKTNEELIKKLNLTIIDIIFDYPECENEPLYVVNVLYKGKIINFYLFDKSYEFNGKYLEHYKCIYCDSYHDEYFIIDLKNFISYRNGCCKVAIYL